MARLTKRVYYCPICRKQLETSDWSAPMCEEDNKQMRPVTAGRAGVFVKQ